MTGLPETASFATRLTHYRQRMGWSQIDLVRRTQPLLRGATLQPWTLCRYESGRGTPKREVLAALSEALGTTVDELAPRRIGALATLDIAMAQFAADERDLEERLRALRTQREAVLRTEIANLRRLAKKGALYVA